MGVTTGTLCVPFEVLGDFVDSNAIVVLYSCRKITR
jgi:hypothetical protein